MECSWIRIAVGCPRPVGLLAGCNQVGHRLPYQSPSRTQCPLWRGTSLIILNGISHLLLLFVILHEKIRKLHWLAFWGYSPWNSITGVQKILFCHSLKDVCLWLQTWLCILWRVKRGLLRFLLLLKWCPIDLQQIIIPGLRDDNFLVVPVMLLMIGALKFCFRMALCTSCYSVYFRHKYVSMYMYIPLLEFGQCGFVALFLSYM